MKKQKQRLNAMLRGWNQSQILFIWFMNEFFCVLIYPTSEVKESINQNWTQHTQHPTPQPCHKSCSSWLKNNTHSKEQTPLFLNH